MDKTDKTYPLYNKQLTVYVTSANAELGLQGAIDFYWRFPQLPNVPTIEKCIIQLIQFQLLTPTSLVLDVANTHASNICIRTDLGHQNCYGSYTNGNETILATIPAYEIGSIIQNDNSIYYYNAYDKTFQTTMIGDPRGKLVRFRLTNINDGDNLRYNSGGGHPSSECLMVLNIFY